MMRLRSRSILWRIVSLQLLALLVVAVALPLAITVLLNATVDSFENRTLEEHARTIASYLEPTGGGGWRLDLPADLRTFYANGFDGFAYSIVDGRGHLLLSSLKDHGPIAPGLMPRARSLHFSRRHGKSVYYGALVPERRAGRRVWVEVAQDLDHPDVIVDDIVARFLRVIAWFALPTMALLLLAHLYIVSRALRPVRRASELAGTIDSSRLDLRLPEADMPSEILPLVHAVNQALERLQGGFDSLREFTADAAHELRTPLSVLRLRIDTMVDRGEIGSLRGDIDAMSHAVEQLLAVAEIEMTDAATTGTADLTRVCADVVALLAPVALEQRKEIALCGPSAPVWVTGSSNQLFLAIRNLADNAIRHTPEGTCVEIEVAEHGVVRVVDRGPGVRPEDRAAIFRRFWRRDTNGGGGGVGLGLAIVRRIVEAHRGSVQVVAGAGCGAVFEIRLHPVSQMDS